MSYRDITPGDKIGKPQAARFIKSRAGTLGLEISFQFEEKSTGNEEVLNWVGWLSSGAMEYTMDTLVNVLGFNGNDSCKEDGTLSDPQALAYLKDVKLVVELETYEGKTFPKIKWVNRIGGSAFEGCQPEIIKLELDKSGFKAAFLAAKQAAGPTKQDVPF